MEKSNNLSLPYIMPSQAQKHVTHNEAIRLLDSMVQMRLLSVELNEPPDNPVEGNAFGIGDNPQGEWLGHETSVATWQDGVWQFIEPSDGWRAAVGETPQLMMYQAGEWLGFSFGSLNKLGLNSVATDNRRLAVSTDEVLFDADGDEVRVYVNRPDSSKNASIVFQNSYSGQAEIGLVANGDFMLKLFDGIDWVNAIKQSNGNTLELDRIASINGSWLGGVRNLVVNGSFNQWQRGGAHTVGNGLSSFTADCWKVSNNLDQDLDIQRDTILPPHLNEGFSLKLTPATTSAAGSVVLSQRIESGLQYFANEPATLSFWIKGGANVQINTRIGQSTKSHVLTGDWQKIVQTANLGDYTSENVFSDGSLQFHVLDMSLDQEVLVCQCQLEIGTTASKFEQVTPDLDTQRCQRYLQVYGKGAWTAIATGCCDTQNRCIFPLQLPVKFWQAPQAIFEGSFGVSSSNWHPLSSVDNVTFSTSLDHVSVLIQKTAAFIAGQCALLLNEGDPDGRLILSSELG